MIDDFDHNYGAALYILTSSKSTWKKAESYVDTHHTSIDFEGLLKDVHFSHAYSLLIEIAYNLFNGNEPVNLSRLGQLDEENFKIAHTAMWIYFHGLKPDDLYTPIDMQ